MLIQTDREVRPPRSRSAAIVLLNPGIRKHGLALGEFFGAGFGGLHGFDEDRAEVMRFEAL